MRKTVNFFLFFYVQSVLMFSISSMGYTCRSSPVVANCNISVLSPWLSLIFLNGFFFNQDVPTLLNDPKSKRGIAFESSSFTVEPFALESSLIYGRDRRTRIMLFATNISSAVVEGSSLLSVTAEDSNGRIYPLNVEYVGPVPGLEWLCSVVVRLSDDIGDVGDVKIRISLQGIISEPIIIGIGHLGSLSPTPTPTLTSTPIPTLTPAPTPTVIPTPFPQNIDLPSGLLTRFSSNPLLRPGPEIFDKEKTGPRVVLKLGPSDYRMWYEAVGGPNQATVGYATSIDGYTWTKKGIVLSPSAIWEGGPSGEISPNSIILESGVFKLWYHSFSDGFRRIGLATSSDGINWSKYPTPVLDLGAAGSFDDQMVVEPRVFKVGMQYRMYYGGMSSSQQGVGVYRLMMAISADGIIWQKSPRMPLFGPFDSGFGIIYDNGLWHMWFGRSGQGLGYAWSEDGLTWQEGPNKVVLNVNPDPMAYDSLLVGDSVSVYLAGDEYRIMYTGVHYEDSNNSWPEAICLATVKRPVVKP